MKNSEAINGGSSEFTLNSNTSNTSGPLSDNTSLIVEGGVAVATMLSVSLVLHSVASLVKAAKSKSIDD